MTEMSSTIIAVFVSALVPALLGALGTPIMGGYINTSPQSLLGLTVVFYFFSLLAVLLFGAPLFLLFRSVNLVRWWSAVILGAVAGGLVALCLRLPDFNIRDFRLTVPEGMVSGVVFWLIWRTGAYVQPGVQADVHEKP